MQEKFKNVRNLKLLVPLALTSLVGASLTVLKMYNKNKVTEKKWSDYFDKSRNHTKFEPVFEETAEKIENNFADTSSKLRAWDCGTGTGKIALMLAKRPNQRWNITATDKREKALDITEERANKEGISSITVKKQDLVKDSIPETYHYITGSRVLPFIEPKDHNKVVDKIVSQIEPGGCFVGHFFGPNHTWCQEKDRNLTCLTKEQIKPLFAKCDGAYHAEETYEEAPATSGEQVYWHEILVTACKNRL